MNKGFYPLNITSARNATYWASEVDTPQWEALDWKREIDSSFSRSVTSACKLIARAPEPRLLDGFSLFRESDVKRSQNCAIVGRRVVARLCFNKSTSVQDVVATLMDGLRDDNGGLPAAVLDLFLNVFEVNGAPDEHAEAMFWHLQAQDAEQVASNMTTHEYLVYQLRAEHQTRDVRLQLECLEDAHSVLCSEAPVHLAEATRIRAACEHIEHRSVRSVVAAMRQMAAYYLHGNNPQPSVSYAPDIVKFSVSVQQKSDAFSAIFLAYYKTPSTDAEFAGFVAESCHIFGAAGKVDWAERDLARRTFEKCVHTAERACVAFAKDSAAWQAFRDHELPAMRASTAAVEKLDGEASVLMSRVAQSLGVTQGGELLAAFEAIFLSLSRSLKSGAKKRQIVRDQARETAMLRQAPGHGVGSEEVRTNTVVEPKSVCNATYLGMLVRAIRALVC